MTLPAASLSRSSPRRSAWLAAPWLLACLVLGGASNAGIIGNALLQLGALAILAMALWHGSCRVWPAERLLVAAAGLFIGWGLLSLVPLPPQIWASLPGRQPVADGYALLGLDRPWLPVSLSAERTLRSLLAVMVPIATYLLARGQTAQTTTRMIWTLLALALLSVMLGIAQYLGGTESPLRPYQITNRTVAVGLFANANHFATFLVTALALGLAVSFQVQRKRRGGSARWPVDRAMPFAVIGIAGIGLLLAGSSAGLMLAIPAVLIGWLVHQSKRGLAPGRPAKTLALAALIGLGLVVALLASGRIADKLGTSAVSRTAVTSGTLAAAADHFPVGSGLGSFAQVYLAQSGGQGTTREWMNHAHNDLAELTLEYGLPGILALILAAAWLIRSSWIVWSGGTPGGETRDQARAGVLAIWIIAIHSLVDYPLRTAAISALLGLCAALVVNALAPPPQTDPTSP